MVVYVNGAKVVDDADGVSTTLTLSVLPQLRVGDNLIAATCKDVILPEHAFAAKLVGRTH